MQSSDWFSLSWFYPETLKNFEYEYPWLFYAMIILPIIYFLVEWIKGRLSPKIPIALKKDTLTNDFSAILRVIPILLLLVSALLMLLALARPQLTNERVEQWTEGIDIMLVMDISESMKIEDFSPNRLEAAKDVANNFIGGRFQDRIGLVIFSGEAYSLSPLTTDYELLKSYIDDIDFKMIESSGTAIGSALAVGTNRMLESETKSKVLILLSDGDNNAGNIDPLTAAKLANAYDIKIYTIAIGKEGKVPYGKDFFGRTRYIENSMDVSGLKEIAKIGEGEFYRAEDNEALVKVFETIDQYEKAEIKETRYKDTKAYYDVYLKWAILFLLLWLFTKSTFFSNILVD
ncbi:VWA domain-containing protein [Marivirga sp. S37H4]|uniref:VWA domain-containing protein n=1 Tax=Marivirga aurantiaca TaxID=2802615 RepID=A0A934WW48_9BACT|nr:VWA domain-containing protein [Marivirga aurantiaca]MBK6264153.1 VWA domain-containing protein [Marivirga aurantiaca]